MRTLRVLVITPTGGVEDKRIVAELDTLQAIVGGYIEAVTPNVEGVAGWHAYCNEEGKLLGMPANWHATRLARKAGWESDDVLVGTVVFLGETEDGDGEQDDADVPDELVTLLGTV